MKLFRYLFIISAIWSCNSPGTSPGDAKMIDLAQPITLYGDTTRISLADYFTEKVTIDSVVSDIGLNTSLLNEQLFIVRSTDDQPISNLTIYAEGIVYSLPVQNRFASDLAREDHPKARMISHDHNKTTIRVIAKDIEQVYAYWNNFRVAVDRSEDTLTVKIPPFAKYEGRSHIRLYACNSYNESNDILIPLHKGKVITDVSKLNSQDWISSTIYYTDLRRFGDHTLRGMVDSILDGHFNRMGVNTLWLSSLTPQSEGAHSHPLTLSTIDDQLGNASDVRALLNVAHQHGLAVILDINLHHLDSGHAMLRANPDFIVETEKDISTLDLNNRKLSERIIDSCLHWIDTYDFDGLHYTGNSPFPIDFRQQLNDAIRSVGEKKGKRFIQVASYNADRVANNQYLSYYRIDGLIDRKFYSATLNAMANHSGSFIDLATALEHDLNVYGHHRLMLNLSSHLNEPDFRSNLAKFRSDDQVYDSVLDKQLVLHHAINTMIPGLPVVTSGDEHARIMASGREGVDTHLNELIRLRNTNMALLYGSTEVLYADENILVIRRKYFENEVTMMINKGETMTTTKQTRPYQVVFDLAAPGRSYVFEVR